MLRVGPRVKWLPGFVTSMCVILLLYVYCNSFNSRTKNKCVLEIEKSVTGQLGLTALRSIRNKNPSLIF